MLPITSDLVDQPPEPRYDNGEAQFSVSADGFTLQAIDTAADYTEDWWWLDNSEYLDDEGAYLGADISFDMMAPPYAGSVSNCSRASRA